MTALWLILLIGAPEALTGIVRVAGPAQNRTILLRVEQRDVALAGDLLCEVGHLAAARIEVLGHRETDSDVFRLEDYRIVSVSGQLTPPLTGTLRVQPDGSLALQDGEGTPVPLSASPAAKGRLIGKAGSKIWVYGKKLVSGELKVQLFGVLREGEKPCLEAK